MSKTWSALSAGALAGAAGATALNAVTYLDQAVRGDAATSSAAGPTPAEAAGEITGADAARAAGLGPLGGLAIGVGVGAVAGLVRGGLNATPPAAVAAMVTGLAAMLVGDGVAVATGTAKDDWLDAANLVRDLVPHLVYGAVTGVALHRMLDPHTSVFSR